MTFTGQNAAKDQAGLVTKLDNASTQLSQGKLADAIQKLTQFRDKVQDLDAQSKIAHADAVTLINRANDALTCIQNVSSGN